MSQNSSANTTQNVCIVCRAFSHSAPMTSRTVGDAELFLCEDPRWCQARAGANAIKALGLEGEVAAS